MIPYDGMSDGLFSTTSQHIFTRDLLDAWMFDVCGVGMSLKDAFASWKRESSSYSDSSIWLQNPPLLKRRMGNVSFNTLLRTLRFSKASNLFDLFLYRTCKTNTSAGISRWKGVVIDGTATGILSRLPKFHRPSLVIRRMRGNTSEQYLMSPPLLWEFTDSIFKSAKKNEGRPFFEVETSPVMNKNLQILVETFFYQAPLRKEYFCAYTSKSLLKICLKRDMDSCDKLSLVHVISDQSVRSSIVEFGRYFISGVKGEELGQLL